MERLKKEILDIIGFLQEKEGSKENKLFGTLSNIIDEGVDYAQFKKGL